MTANLVANYSQEQAERSSSRPHSPRFVREGDKHAADTTIEALEHSLEKEESAAHCERGPVEEYMALVESAQPEGHNDRISSILGAGRW